MSVCGPPGCDVLAVGGLWHVGFSMALVLSSVSRSLANGYEPPVPGWEIWACMHLCERGRLSFPAHDLHFCAVTFLRCGKDIHGNNIVT